MIVFYFVIFGITISILILFSSVIFEVENIEISDVEKLKEIFRAIENKKYQEIFDYIKIKLKIKISVFSKIKITLINMNEKKLKVVIKNIIKKENLKMKINPKEYKRKREIQKERLKRILKNNSNYLELESIKLSVGLGLSNAEATAITIGILNSVTSIVLFKYLELSKRARKMYKRMEYIFSPIFSDEFEFYLKTKLKIKIIFLRFFIKNKL